MSKVSTNFSAEDFFADWDGQSWVAVDVETKGIIPSEGILLGVSLAYRGKSGGVYSTYVPCNHWINEQPWPFSNYNELSKALGSLPRASGANFVYDYKWIKEKLGVELPFVFDTQVAWHHSDNSYSERSYGLKALQKTLLGWPIDNAKELEENVRSKGGSLKNGDHYLADLEVLGKYAALDAEATLLGTEKLEPFFIQHDYSNFLKRSFSYRAILDEATTEGICIDRLQLRDWIMDADTSLKHLQNEFSDLCPEIGSMENDWDLAKAASYKREHTRARYLANPDRFPRFNLNSNPHLAELFYDRLGEVCIEKTKGGDRAVHRMALKGFKHPAAKVLLRFNELQKSLEYAQAYLAVLGADDRLHPRYNVTGTVSGRLSCFAPNIQQAPMDELELMACFKVPTGRVGIGADLTSVEPFFTAIYSEDPTLLKVYRDGLGDIYLDLCLKLFPENAELREKYQPSAPPSEDIKTLFKLIRAIAKLVHLACQYGAGARKIAQILTQNGFPTSETEGKRLHKLYWASFRKVKDLEAGLYDIYRAEGRIRNPFGRIIQLPDFWCKDLLNRFIQSTGHDALVEWVLRFKRLAAERRLDVGAFVPDWHDATYWHTCPEQADAVEQCLKDALTEVNSLPEMIYPLKAAYKRFSTLAEIK